MSTHPVPNAALSQALVVLGKTRSGKSSKLRLLVEGLLDRKKPVCMIDPKGDWWGIKSSANGKKAGYDVVIFGGDHADVPINRHSGKVVAELVATGNRPCLIDLGGWMVADRTQFFIDFASTLFTRTRGHRWLVIDECHNFAPQGKVLDPRAGLSLHWANRIASEGAGKGIVLFSASQRPQKVHKDYLTSHETLIACRVIHKLDRDADKDWIDACGDPAQGKEVLATLAGMKREEGWVYSPEIEFGPKRVTFPLFKTYDSFKPQTGKARKLKGWASVNLDAVKDKLAAVVEEEKAKDPQELRKQLAEKNAEIAKLKAASARPAPPPSVDAGTIRDAEKRGFEAAKKKLGAAAEVQTKKAIAKGIEVVLRQVAELTAKLQKDLKEVQGSIEAPSKILAFTAAPPALRAVPASPPPARAATKTPPPGAPSAAAGGVIPPVQQRILDAIAWATSIGTAVVPREMAAFLAGVSPTSSSYDNHLGALRSAGLIAYVESGMVTLTPEGSERAIAPGVALTHETMVAKIREKIVPVQMRILEGAIEAYPENIAKEDLALKTGISPTSSSYDNHLGRLRTLGLVTYPEKGRVRADDRLFPAGRAA